MDPSWKTICTASNSFTDIIISDVFLASAGVFFLLMMQICKVDFSQAFWKRPPVFLTSSKPLSICFLTAGVEPEHFSMSCSKLEPPVPVLIKRIFLLQRRHTRGTPAAPNCRTMTPSGNCGNQTWHTGTSQIPEGCCLLYITYYDAIILPSNSF